MVDRRLVPLVLVALAAVALLVALWPPAHRVRTEYVASWTLTPGVTNPDVTQATIASTICVTGWTRTIRPPASYTSELKLEQMRAYGSQGTPDQYQEDHLISLELGGHPTDPHNLWPEPRPHADEVDQVENRLNDDVCAGRLTLAEAQRKEAQLKHTTG